MRFQKHVASRSLSVLAIYGALEAPISYISFLAGCHIATEQTQVQADAHQVGEATAKALKPVIDESTVIVKQLEDVLAKALPSEKDSNWRRRVKALSSLAQDKKVAQPQASLERHVPILTYHQTVDIAKTSRQLPIHFPPQEPKLASQPTRPQPCFMVRFEQAPNFVGREAELDEIDARFK